MSELSQGPSGKLVVKVVSQSHSLLPGAKVVVKDLTGNVIHELNTDQYGNTKTIDLPAPSKELALTNPAIKPYSQYIVTAEHPQYAPVQMLGVQIFETFQSYPNH